MIKRYFIILIVFSSIAFSQDSTFIFPLNVGNKWIYSQSFGYGEFDTEYSYREISIEKDTIINCKQYFQYYSFLRYDSLEQDLYIYKTFEDTEYVFMEFNADVGDSSYGMESYWSKDYYIQSIGTTNRWGGDKKSITVCYLYSIGMMRMTIYRDFVSGIGITGESNSGHGGDATISLVYAQINGKEYGDSVFFELEKDTTKCLSFYPLQISNKWVYSKDTFYNDFWGDHFKSDTIQKEVVGDTIMSNDIKYFVIQEWDSLGSNGITYERVDSINGKAYRYNCELNIEILIEDLFAIPGNTIESYRYCQDYPSDNYQMYTIFENKIKFCWNDQYFDLKKYQTYDLDMDQYSLLNNVGLFSHSYEFDFGHTTYQLLYAKIGNNEYGDSKYLSIDNSEKIANDFILYKNYPNPFNPITAIEYKLPKRSNIKLQIFDLRGNFVEELVNENQSSGYYKINWNASNNPSGLYFYRLITNDNIFQKNVCY